MPRYSALLVAAVLCGCTRAPVPMDAGGGPAGSKQPAVPSNSSSEAELTQVVLDVPGMH